MRLKPLQRQALELEFGHRMPRSRGEVSTSHGAARGARRVWKVGPGGSRRTKLRARDAPTPGGDQRRADDAAATPGPGSPVGRPGGETGRRRDHHKSVAARSTHRPMPASAGRVACVGHVRGRCSAGKRHGSEQNPVRHRPRLARRPFRIASRRRQRRDRPRRGRVASAQEFTGGLRPAMSSTAGAGALAPRPGDRSSRSTRSMPSERDALALHGRRPARDRSCSPSATAPAPPSARA